MLFRHEGPNGRFSLVIAVIDVLVVERCLSGHDWGTQTFVDLWIDLNMYNIFTAGLKSMRFFFLRTVNSGLL